MQQDLKTLALHPGHPEASARLGDALRAFLAQVGWAEDEAHIQQALRESPPKPVNVVLCLEAAELFALPWELATLGDGSALGKLTGVNLRFQWPGTQPAEERPAPRPEGGRLLFAWSAAGGAVPADEHLAAIEAAMAEAGLPFDRDRDVLPAATYDAIAERLASSPACCALHLLAHGVAVPDSGASVGLALDDGVLHAGLLHDLLHPHRHALRLVVLCGCRSGDPGALGSHLGSLAQRIHRAGIESVIASRFPLTVPGSVALTRTLYRALVADPLPHSLEQALSVARAALRAQRATASDATSVQLYGGDGDILDTRPFVFRPYRGLLAFGPQHSRFFFGRDRERDEVLAALHALSAQARPRLQVVEGPSGSGKSSLVLAAVVPALQREGWSWAAMVPGAAPLVALGAALSRLDAARGPQRLLVVDQLEELFTQVSDERRADRDAFVQRLWELASAPGGPSVICTLRTDFRGRCGELSLETGSGRRLDSLFTSGAAGHSVYVPQLDPDALRSVIEQPAEAVGLGLEPGLCGRMLADVGAEPGALPLLEYALDQLWEQREGCMLTQQAYEAIGGAAGALRERAEAVVTQLDEEACDQARRLLVRLVGPADTGAQDTRRRVALTQIGGHAPEEQDAFAALVDALVAERLVVRGEGEAGESTLEVAHEALIRSWPRLRRWVDESREVLQQVERVERARADWQAGQGDLLRGRSLVLAQGVQQELGEAAADFVRQSERAEGQRAARARRRTRLILLGATLVALIMTGLAVWALGQWHTAQEATRAAQQATTEAEQAREEKAREAANAESARLHAQDALLMGAAQRMAREEAPTRAAMLLAEMNTPADLPGFNTLAVDLLYGPSPAATTFWAGHDMAVLSVAFSPDASLVATGSLDTTKAVWRADGTGKTERTDLGHWVQHVSFAEDGAGARAGREPAVPAELPPLLALLSGLPHAVSADGALVAAGYQDGTAQVWRLSERAPATLDGGGGPILAAAFTDGGAHIVTVAPGGVLRWPADGRGTPERLPVQLDEAGTAALSPDGALLAFAEGARVLIQRLDGAGTPVVLEGHTEPVNTIQFSPDGTLVVTGSNDKTARVWSTDGAGSPVELKHDDGVGSVAFSADGTRVCSACSSWGQSGTAYLWPAQGGEALDGFSVYMESIHLAALSPDGRLVATAGDMRVRLWTVGQEDEPSAEDEGGEGKLPLWDLAGMPETLTFSPDGAYVLVGTSEGSIELGRVNRDAEVFSWKAHDDGVTGISFSPDGGWLLSSSLDGTARLWRVSTESLQQALRDLHGCLPPTDRMRLLGEPKSEAAAHYSACQVKLGREEEPWFPVDVPGVHRYKPMDTGAAER